MATGEDRPAQLELKKKLDGTVYKRRASMSVGGARQFASQGIVPQVERKNSLNRQILRELAWALRVYGELEPLLAVYYERSAYRYSEPDAVVIVGAPELRITIDRRVSWCEGDWACFAQGSEQGERHDLLSRDICIMEIKGIGGLPLALAQLLDNLAIYPTSFSKVGRAYQASLRNQ
jgi:hypothetical protein